jgi:hypothetical protein
MKRFTFMMRNLKHEGLLEYREMMFSVEKRTAYLMMECWDGKDLREEMNRKKGKIEEKID